MTDSLSTRLLGFVSVLTGLAAWDLLARVSGWSPVVFPGPEQVGHSLLEMLFDGTLIRHSVASLFRVTCGFYLAVIVGIPLGIVLGRCALLRGLLNPLLQFLKPISPLAWIPLSMLWFGIGDRPAVFLIFLASVFPLVVSTSAAVQSINPTYFHVAANFNFSRWKTTVHIIVPAILPSVVTALRITASIAWLVVVAAEMIAVKSGLGYLILDSRNALRTDCVMASMIVIGLIGVILDSIMLRLRKLDFLAWANMGS